MKTKFFEQYSLTDEKLKEIWESGLVVFDTNILLNLYRYNKQTCDDILNYMQPSVTTSITTFTRSILPR